MTKWRRFFNQHWWQQKWILTDYSLAWSKVVFLQICCDNISSSSGGQFKLDLSGLVSWIGCRKKVRAEKSLNHRKSWTFFLSNFFPQKVFWFIWKQRCYSNNGRPLILKLVPNDEVAWFSWNWQRKSILKRNVTVLKTAFYVKINHKSKVKSVQLGKPHTEPRVLRKVCVVVGGDGGGGV